jgi:MFS family permease
MYGPSFFTGSLIARFGARAVVGAGLALSLGAVAAGLSGITEAHFVVGLILLGLGWNFGFVGASALVLETHRPEERNKVQAFNDFLVFGTMAVGSFSSGHVLAGSGWAAVNWILSPRLDQGGLRPMDVRATRSARSVAVIAQTALPFGRAAEDYVRVEYRSARL